VAPGALHVHTHVPNLPKLPPLVFHVYRGREKGREEGREGGREGGHER
jgi:hypothetical protein